MDIREELKEESKQDELDRQKTNDPHHMIFLAGKIKAREQMLFELKDKQILILEPGEIGLRFEDKAKARMIKNFCFGRSMFKYEFDQLKKQLGAEDE